MWRSNVQQVGLLVPGVGVGLEVGRIGLEDEGAILVDHADETGAAGAAIEPEHHGVIIRVSLRVEEHIVEGPMGEVEIT